MRPATRKFLGFTSTQDNVKPNKIDRIKAHYQIQHQIVSSSVSTRMTDINLHSRNQKESIFATSKIQSSLPRNSKGPIHAHQKHFPLVLQA
jgi:hypothetical protein